MLTDIMNWTRRYKKHNCEESSLHAVNRHSDSDEESFFCRLRTFSFFFPVGNVGGQPQGGMVGHGGHGGHGGRGGGSGHYNAGLSLASRPPNAAGFVHSPNMGQLRPDKGSSNSRYNPIGMGGGYNVYNNWN